MNDMDGSGCSLAQSGILVGPYTFVFTYINIYCPNFLHSLYDYYFANAQTFLFDYASFQTLVKGDICTGPQGIFLKEDLPLIHTGRSVDLFGTNRLKAYTFSEVLRTDTLDSGYLCVWAANGEYPTNL